MIIFIIVSIFLVIIGIGVAIIVCASGKLSQNECKHEFIPTKDNHNSKKKNNGRKRF